MALGELYQEKGNFHISFSIFTFCREYSTFDVTGGQS